MMWTVLIALALAQLPSSGQLSGEVRDPSGAVVSGTSLTVFHMSTGLLRATSSGEDGSYAIPSLPEGEYKVTARKGGFRTVARLGVRLGRGEAIRLDFDLELGGMQEFITIEGATATINTEDASSGIRIDQEMVRVFPVNGRTLQGIISFAPGVLATPATFGEAGQFSVNGQRPNANYFVTDGVSSNSGVGSAGLPGQFSGGTLPAMTALGTLQGMAVPAEIREVLVKTSTFAPEFGRMPGAQIIVQTAAGSNAFRGDAAYSFRHERLAARDYLAKRAGLGRSPLRLNDFHAAFGGPIQKDKTFFFTAIESLRLRQPIAWKAPAPSALARQLVHPIAQPFLDVFPNAQRSLSPLYGETTLETSWPGGLTSGSVRVDRSLGSSGALFVRYHDTDSENRVGLVQINDSTIRDRSLTIGVTHSPGTSMVNDLRLNFSRTAVRSSWTPGLATAATLSSVRALLPTTQAPQRLYGVAISGLGSVVSTDESQSAQGQFQVIDTLAIASGRHQIRLGFDYLRLTPSRSEDIATSVVRYTRLEDVISGLPPAMTFGVAPGGSSLIEIASAFAQDTWNVTERLNVTYGARWEYIPPPSSRVAPPAFISTTGPLVGAITPQQFFAAVNSVTPPFSPSPDWNSRFGRIAPRAGIAYRLSRESRWVVRAGFGAFYDLGFASAIDPLNSVPFNSWRAGITQVPVASLPGVPPGGIVQVTPSGGAPPVSDQSGVLTGAQYGFASNLGIPYSWQWNLTLEGETPRIGVASAAWVGSSGRSLLRREGYLATFAPPDSIPPALILATSHGESVYHSLQFHFRRRLASGLGGIASYAWSHSIDNGSWDSGAFLAGAAGGTLDRGSSNFDVRHAFSAGFQYDVSWRKLPRFAQGWSILGIARARTGFPVDILVRENVFGSGLDNAPRPDVIPGVPIWINDSSVPGGRRLNPAAFAGPVSRVTGNLGRNVIRGAGLAQLDAAIERKFRFSRSEVRFRLQAYNLTNAVALGDPVRILNSPLFGQSVSMTNLMLGAGRPISGLTPAFQSGGPRTFEASIGVSFGR